jgi:hypothetical protein
MADIMKVDDEHEKEKKRTKNKETSQEGDDILLRHYNIARWSGPIQNAEAEGF